MYVYTLGSCHQHRKLLVLVLCVGDLLLDEHVRLKWMGVGRRGEDTRQYLDSYQSCTDVSNHLRPHESNFASTLA